MKYGWPADPDRPEVQLGDRVERTMVDDGAPEWATTGTVVGDLYTRVLVEWDDYVHHVARRNQSVHPAVLKLIEHVHDEGDDIAAWTSANPVQLDD